MFSFSGLLAIVMDDFTIVVVEVDTGNIVRRLTGHEERLTDLAFSPDARWLVSSAQDCSNSTLGLAYWNVSAEKPIGSFLLINKIIKW